MKNVIIAILVALLIVAGFMIVAKKKANIAYEPWPETEPAISTNNKPQTDPIACSPSITVSSPTQGATYTTGQQVTIKWTSCGVQNVDIGLVSGGKDHGQISQTPIPASQGSYQWTATNPAKGFTGLNTNIYQIGIISGNVVAKSGMFTVTTPSNSSNLENTETPLFIKNIYQKDGKWWADVDYVTIWNDLQLIEYKINTGLCVLPNMTKQQALNYVQTADLQSGYFKDQNNEGCHVPEHPGDGGNIVNQNPLIRSFPFASNFKTINGCYTENDTTIQEYKNQVESFRTYSNGNLTNLNYSYGVFNTQGTYKRKAIIKNSEIETFDQINGCAG